MERRNFGSTKRTVPVIGQGSWKIRESDRRPAIAAIQRGIDLGMTHLDTAELYEGAESIIAEAIAGRRDDVFVVSKVLPQHASRARAIEACEQSLTRLRIEKLDCYLLHWRGGHPLEETIGAFEDLVKQGKILAWGLSNFGERDLDEALAIAGEGRIACNQVLYHLEQRAIEHAVLPWCEKHGIAVVGYTPFGQGPFPDASSAPGRVLAEIATAHQATPRQVALAFLVRKPALFAIPKASKVHHVTDNAGAGDLRLSAEEIARIDKAFPLGRRTHELPTA
ncbi:MAG: aldo/keto reductase [Polyangiaceae bacterium]